jgi:hypothetical protein
VDKTAAMEDRIMVSLKRLSFALSLTLALATATALSARADEHEHGGGGGHPAGHGRVGGVGHPGFGHGGFHDFRGRDFAHFSPQERAMWQGGSWHHEWHHGHFGWWWGVGGAFYFYADPIYPYPTDVSDDVSDESAAPMPVYAPGYWYFCSASGVYYPYVQTCAVPWTPVPPTPPQ